MDLEPVGVLSVLIGDRRVVDGHDFADDQSGVEHQTRFERFDAKLTCLSAMRRAPRRSARSPMPLQFFPELAKHEFLHTFGVVLWPVTGAQTPCDANPSFRYSRIDANSCQTNTDCERPGALRKTFRKELPEHP